MVAERGEPQFIDDERGAVTTSYGPYLLKSAFQPIFSQDETGHLAIEGFEALIRPFRGGQGISPAQFFPMIEPGDARSVDTLCRELHILNMARLNRRRALLFVNFNPGLFRHGANVDEEVARLLNVCRRAGLPPNRIVCEMTEQGSEEEALSELVLRLRASRFRIAIDDYGADESDINRVDRLRPDVIKFDAAWVRRYSETPAGKGLLRLMVDRFVDRGIDCLFEGLEEEHQIAFCQEIGVRLMQGYALARPEIAPTDFDLRFPDREGELPAESGRPVRPQTLAPAAETRFEAPVCPPRLSMPLRRTVTFGRRHR